MVRFLIQGILFSLLITGSLYADSVELEAISDAYIWNANPNTNYGSGVVLYGGYDGSHRLKTLILFDLSSIPADADIFMGELYLWCNVFHGTPSSGIGCSCIIEIWDENSVTWNNEPNSSSVSKWVDWPGSGDWLVFDLTPRVQEWHAGTLDNYGVKVYSSGSTVVCYCNFDSRESSDTTTRPKLVVSYTTNELEHFTWASIKSII